MPKLKIPFDFDSAFLLLTKLTIKELKSLIDTSGSISGLITSYKHIEELEASEKIDSDHIQQIFSLFVNLISAIETTNIEVDSMIEDITSALKERKIDHDETINESLRYVLSNKDSLFYLKCKASLLAFDNENPFKESKIFTDIRPIFGKDLDEEVQGSIIFHKLKLDFYVNGNIETKYVTLDLNDLNELKNQLIRAENKEKALKENYSTKGHRIFEI